MIPSRISPFLPRENRHAVKIESGKIKKDRCPSKATGQHLCRALPQLLNNIEEKVKNQEVNFTALLELFWNNPE